jgi:hypothetical protein
MGIENHERHGYLVWLVLAFGLAIGLHLLVAGLIVSEVFRSYSENRNMPTLELASLKSGMMVRPLATQEMAPQGSPAENLLPMRIVNGANKLGQVEKTTRDILRAVRKGVLTRWEPAQPAGRGRAVVLLEFDDEARVRVAQIATVSGTKDFIGFMEDFSDQLQGLRVAEDHCALIRVECEFRVGE